MSDPLDFLLQFHGNVGVGDTVRICIGEKTLEGEVYVLNSTVAKVAKPPLGMFNTPEWVWQRWDVPIQNIDSYEILTTAYDKYSVLQKS